MPLTSAQLTSSFSTTLAKTLNGFGASTVTPAPMAFNLIGLNLTTWNQAFEQIYTLFTAPPAGLTGSAVSGGTLGLNLLAAPAAPTVSNAGTGGTIAAGIYQVEVTYTNPAGETVASASASTTTTGTTSTITINSPAASGNATGWYAYVTQAGGATYTRQQGTPTAIGTNITLTAPPTSSGVNPPASNTATQPYYYKVTAVGYGGFNTTNETTPSNEVSVTLATGSQTASLAWTALVGAVSYNVYRGTAAGGENLLVANATGASYLDTGAAAGTSQSPPGAMPNNFVEFDLSTFTNLVAETATAGHVLGITILPTGTVGSSQCALAPGTTNGLTWFFGAASPLTLPINGEFRLMGPPSGSAGQAITATSKTLRVTNGGTVATTVQIAAIVGP